MKLYQALTFLSILMFIAESSVGKSISNLDTIRSGRFRIPSRSIPGLKPCKRVIINPLTGEKRIVDCPDSEPSNSNPQPEPTPTEPTQTDSYLAYDYFDTDAVDFSMTNAFLLASASIYVYKPPYWGQENEQAVSVYEDDPYIRGLIAQGTSFTTYLKAKMEEFGLPQEGTVFVEEPGADAHGAVFSNDEIVILAFRGSDSMLDYFANFNVELEARKEWGQDVLVHHGDAMALEFIFDELAEKVVERMEEGKTLWITGHSLGGAMAVLAAMQFETDPNLPQVQGVHTFGNPRVGNFAFKEAYDTIGLGARTWRWAIEGDPAPNLIGYGPYTHCQRFPEAEVCTPIGCWTKPAFDVCGTGIAQYEHVGVSHLVYDISTSVNDPDYSNIEIEKGGNTYSLEVKLDTDDIGLQNTASGINIEHLLYDDVVLSKVFY